MFFDRPSLSRLADKLRSRYDLIHTLSTEESDLLSKSFFCVEGYRLPTSVWTLPHSFIYFCFAQRQGYKDVIKSIKIQSRTISHRSIPPRSKPHEFDPWSATRIILQDKTSGFTPGHCTSVPDKILKDRIPGYDLSHRIPRQNPSDF